MQTISVSKIFSLAIEPENKILDRFWFNTTNKQLYRCDGTNWIPVKISSDDVVINSNGTQTSLATYLNQQLSIIGDALDNLETNKANLNHANTFNTSNTFNGGSVFNGNVVTLSINDGINGDGDTYLTLNPAYLNISAGRFEGDSFNTSTLSNSYHTIPTSHVVKSYIDTSVDTKLNKASNLADLEDLTKARENLFVYTKLEVQSLIHPLEQSVYNLNSTINDKANTSDVVLNSEIDTVLPTSPVDTHVPSTKLLETILSTKQNKADVQVIQGSYTSISANTFTQLISDTVLANIPGRILITPNIHNTGAIYIYVNGVSATIDTSMPFYPDQIQYVEFANINDIYIATEVSGDKFNYIISTGVQTAEVSNRVILTPVDETGTLLNETVQINIVKMSDGTYNLEMKQYE